ncbi:MULTISPECIES: transposase [Rhodopirellula]|uniref:transposase n=1 Tax=Rhodopirellula TaxID=265488 RepID=UPI00257DAF5C|nr:transposase [Rhodopirellula sp. UBA1907]
MRSLLTILYAIAFVVGTGCDSGTANPTGVTSAEPHKEGISHRQNRELNDLVESMRNALESRNDERLQQLFYTENQPEELTEIFRQQIKTLVRNDKIAFDEVRVYDFEEHHPDPPLPGKFNESQLEFLKPPTHWIIANMSGGDGKATFSLDLTFPACQIDDEWMLVGSKYSEE